MTGPPVTAKEGVEEEARTILAHLDRIDLSHYAVLGDYVRFEEETRNRLKDFRQLLIAGFESHDPRPNNFLLWGPPGSGKTYLVQQIASLLAPAVRYFEVNLSKLDEPEFRATLARIATQPGEIVCLVDEVDAKPGEAWPYEALLTALEPSQLRTSRATFCLAGSGGGDLSAFKDSIRRRPKGTDLLSRIPARHECAVPPLGIGDRLIVAAAQLVSSAREEGREVHEVERLALYYVAVHPALASARQLRALAGQSALRIPRGEDRVRYDYLFSGGDPENKEFWSEIGNARYGLVNSFVEVTGLEPTGRPHRGDSVTRSAPPRPEEEKLDRHRLAVLPFLNISPDAADGYFADGLTEELISTVSHIGGLRVIARTSVMRFRDDPRSAHRAARELRVGTLLEGSVRKAGDDLRITAQLIDARNEEPVWSATFDRRLENVFAIQKEIAQRIAESLKVEMRAPQWDAIGRPPTTSLAAYEYYLKGRQLWWQGGEPSYRAAILHFEKAIELDPDYALAFCGLADSYALLGNQGYIPLSDALEKAEVAARKALALNPNLADAHVSLAPVLYNRYDWPGAEVELRRAVALDSNNVLAHYWLAIDLSVQGKVDEALEHAKRAAAIDPLSRQSALQPAVFLYEKRDFEAAIAYMEEVERRIGLRSEVYRGLCELGLGRLDSALEDLRRAASGPMEKAPGRRTFLAIAFGRAGRTEESRKILDQLEVEARSGPVPAGLLAVAFSALGDRDRAFEWFDRAFEQKTVLGVEDLMVDPLLDGIRSDPRFPGLLRKFNHVA